MNLTKTWLFTLVFVVSSTYCVSEAFFHDQQTDPDFVHTVESEPKGT